MTLFLKVAKVTVVLLLCAWYGWFLFHKIHLARGDVGRHLAAGRIFVAAAFDHDWQTFGKLLFTNFYSFTFPDFFNINHHWGSEIIFYIVYRLGGFALLTIFFAAVSIATFLIFFRLAVRESGWWIPAGAALYLIPLIADRTEVRPEAFSYLFAAIFFFSLWEYVHERVSSRWLWALPFLQILWVNLHIYFFLGPFLIGVFWLDALFQRPVGFVRLKILTALLLVTTMAGAFNPSGIRGLAYPFQIFANYGVVVSENQSAPTWLLAPTYDNPRVFLVALWILIFLIMAFLVLAIIHRERFPFIMATVGLAFGCMAYLAVRNFALFGFFALPALSMLLSKLVYGYAPRAWRRWTGTVALALTVGSIIFLNRHHLQYTDYHFGLGLEPGVSEPVEFIRAHQLRRPLLSTFDIGSYAIFYLFPEYRLFVDNRPEAYPAAFWEQTYRPMHTDETAWVKTMNGFGFETMLYSLEEKALSVRSFIKKRLDDPDWAPVFINQHAVVLVRRNAENISLIEKYEVKKEVIEKYFMIDDGKTRKLGN